MKATRVRRPRPVSIERRTVSYNLGIIAVSIFPGCTRAKTCLKKGMGKRNKATMSTAKSRKRHFSEASMVKREEKKEAKLAVKKERREKPVVVLDGDGDGNGNGTEA